MLLSRLKLGIAHVFQGAAQCWVNEDAELGMGGEKVENDPSSSLEADSLAVTFYRKHKQLFRIESVLGEAHSVTAKD